MARIVVAGANGKVGRMLVRRLVAAGHEVIALVRTELVPTASRCVTDWMNAPLRAADPDDIVVNFTGDINPPRGDYESANTRTAERLRLHYDGRAAHALFMSFAGASTISANRYLRTRQRPKPRSWRRALRDDPADSLHCGTPDRPGKRPQTADAKRACGALLRQWPIAIPALADRGCGPGDPDLHRSALAGRLALEGKDVLQRNR